MTAARATQIAIIVLAILSGGCTARHATGTAKLYSVETLVSGGPMHGAKGITFGPDDDLYVCSVYAQSIYRVNVSTGAVSVAVGPPYGESDDVAFAPDGTMAWSALVSAEVRAQKPGGESYVLANKVPLINPLDYTSDGRLFAAQIGIDRFLEIDVSGEQPPRLVAKGIGHLNSFEINANDELYGPLAGLEKIGRIDLETGEVTIVAEGFGMVSAVNFDSKGQLYGVGWTSGELLRIDTELGNAEVIAQFEPPIDNLAIGPDDMIYVSLPSRGAIMKVDPNNGEIFNVVPGNLSVPGGLALTTVNGKETLIVADDFGFRHVDTQSGRVWAITDLTDFMNPATASDAAANDKVIVLSDVTRSLVYMVNRSNSEITHKWKGIETPYGLVLTDDDEPIVAEFTNGQLIKLSTSDRKARDVIASGLEGPVGLSWADADSVYVAEANAGVVSRVNIKNGKRTIIASGLSQPEGITVMHDGRVAIVEAGAQRVTAVDPATGSATILAENLPVGAEFPDSPGPIDVPSGIVAGADGSLYLSSDQNHSVLRLIPN
ncbi:MAG: hypothetical protein ACR2P6_06555 [Gammaproteobacteria bacterium]